MAAKLVDMTGKKYHSLTAICCIGRNAARASVWLFLCDCGVKFEADGSEVRRGGVKNCPDCARLIKNKAVTTHGKTQTREYKIWCAMKRRCYNKNSFGYEAYGGRGISVCDRWLNSFENFYLDMGRVEKGMTLDRIDVNGNYELSNCRWATRLDQSNNKRNNRKIEINGVTKNLVEWAKECNISESTIRRRIKSGVTGLSLLSMPTR